MLAQIGMKGVARGATVLMTPAQWALVQDNPRQRNTEAHAKKAKHLHKLHPTHAEVHIGILPDGSTYKLDGHTRDLLWRTGKVSAPQMLNVHTWHCTSLQDACDLYGTFDNQAAAETSTDRVSGAVRENQVAFSSGLMRSGRYVSALRVVHGMLYQGPASEYDMIKKWKLELLLLDACAPANDKFLSGVIVAALLTFACHGGKAQDFWTRYARGDGVKVGDVRDGVQALQDRIVRLRLNKSIAGAGALKEIIGVSLSGYERHFDGLELEGGLKTLRDNAVSAWVMFAKKNKEVRRD